MRPTFDYLGNPVRAAGVLLTCGGKTLWRRVKGRYEDMGGKTEPQDTSALDTAVREAVEESNGKLFHQSHTHAQCADVLRKLLEKSETFYNPRAKYLCYVVEAPRHVRSLSMKRFGRFETTDLIPHYYEWKSYVPRNMHPRLWTIPRRKL